MNRFVCLTAALSIVLIRLPALAGGGAARLAVLAPFVAGIMWMRERPQRDTASLAPVLWAFVAVSVVAIVRGQQAGVFGSGVQAATDVVTLLVVASFALLLIRTATVADAPGRLAAVALAPAVFIAANVALQAVGVRSRAVEAGGAALATGDQAEMLRYLGVTAERVQFPLSSGINSTGAVAAAGIAAALLLAIHAPKLVPRQLSLLAAGVCVYGVLTIDSRTALLIAAAVTLVLWARPRAHLAWTALAIPIAPWLAIHLMQQVAAWSATADVTRASEDVATGNNRLFIWEPVWNFVGHPSLDLVLGYGAKGHITSGISGAYADLFPAGPARYSYSAHNLALQAVLDAGYLGLAVVVLVAFVTLRSLHVFSGPLAPALTGVVLVMFGAGTTEAVPNVMFADTMVLTLLAAGVALGYRPAEIPVPEPGRRLERTRRGDQRLAAART